MFRSLLQQEAMKTIPKIDEIVKKICDGLIERKFLDSLSMDVSFLKKALLCYESDIKNAIDSIDEYFLKIIEDLSTSMEDLVEIKKALNKTAC